MASGYGSGALGKSLGRLAAQLKNLTDDLVSAGATQSSDGRITALPSVSPGITEVTSNDASITVTSPTGPTVDLKVVKVGTITDITSNDASVTITNATGPTVDLSVKGAAATVAPLTFAHAGTAVVGTGVSRVPLPAGATIAGVIATANTAPTGADLIFDVKKNGTSVFTTNAKPTIAAGANATAVAAVPNTTALAGGDYVTVDITQVGSTVAGADLVVVVYF